MAKYNSKEIFQPLLKHSETVFKENLKLPFEEYRVDYIHDGFSVYKSSKRSSWQHAIINGYIVESENGSFLKVGSYQPVNEYKQLYSSLIHESTVDELYLESLIQVFFNAGRQWGQFEKIENTPKSLHIDSLISLNNHYKCTSKKHLAKFYYSQRTRNEARRAHGNKAQYSVCTMSLNMAIHQNELKPVYVLNIPVLADIKFSIIVDVHERLEEETIQLLLFKYEKLTRQHLYRVIKNNLRMQEHESMSDFKEYTMEQLVDYVLVTNMIIC